jgi:hypothetical protein
MKQASLSKRLLELGIPTMDLFQPVTTPFAPKLHYRRYAQRFFPLAFLGLCGVAALIGRYLDVSNTILAVWVGCIFLLETIKILISHPTIPLRVYRRWLKLRGKRIPALMNANPQNITKTVALKKQLGLDRHRLIWVLDILVLFAVWGFALYQGWGVSPGMHRAVFIVFLLALSVIPFAMLVTGSVGRVEWAQYHLAWFFISAIGSIMITGGFWLASRDWAMSGAIFSLAGILFLSIYMSERLWLGVEFIGKTVRQLSKEILNHTDAVELLEHIPEEIGENLRYGRVFTLEASPDRQSLQVKGEYGDSPPASGAQFSIHGSICGEAFIKKRPVAWNNVRENSPHLSLRDDDDTWAEIAVPIGHRQVIHGILDVQSPFKGVYGPGDIATLEILGQVVGAAISADKKDKILEKALNFDNELWSTPVNSEQAVFFEFARFGHEVLGADLLVYYPLSYTGFPVHAPYLSGDFYDKQAMERGVTDLNSPLIRLIMQWEFYSDADIDENSLLSHSSSADEPGFVAREKVVSACFLPIGTAQDRQGALLLNFRKPTHFDHVFQFTLVSFAKAFATVAARIRSQEFFYEGFGRPDLGLHNIKDRHGFKSGVGTDGRRMVASLEEAHSFEAVQEINQLFDRVDKFMNEVSLAESTIPPNFGKKSLAQVLDDAACNLPPTSDGRLPYVDAERIDPRIERENIWFKQALYRVITEAMNNAVIHGQASHISVSIGRAQDSIQVEVINNGNPLPDDSQSRKSRSGIFVLLKMFKDKLGATRSIDVGPDGVGAQIFIQIPCLPLER